MRHLRYWLLAGALLGLGPAVSVGQTTGLDSLVDWLAPLVLEETAEAYNARPSLAIDPRGGYLVTDDMIAQVRVYAEDGSLLRFFGRDGDGPGEFRRLTGVARLSSGGFCTVDFQGRLAVWDSAGDLIRDFRLPIRGAMGVAALAGTEVAVVMGPVTATPDSMNVPWVRMIDLNGPTLGAHVLSLPFTAENFNAAGSVGGVLSPTLGSRFGLTWSVFDSLWVVDLGEPRRVRPVRLESSTLGQNTRWVDQFVDRERFVEWMLSATFPGAAHPAPGGGWLVSLYRRHPGSPTTYGLLHVDDGGRRVWEVETSPRLVATDPDRGILYFEESSGLQPNRCERATMRR